MKSKNFNEELKRQEQENKLSSDNKEMALDSTERVKVLSPGRLVFNRFMRNKLALVGTFLLIFMFLFAFIFPLFYPYSQTQIFYKYDKVKVDYAQASERTEYEKYLVSEDVKIAPEVANDLTSQIDTLVESGNKEVTLVDNNENEYLLKYQADHIYALYADVLEDVCVVNDRVLFADYNAILGNIDFRTDETFADDFAAKVGSTIEAGNETFTYGGDRYVLEVGRKQNYAVYKEAREIVYANDALSAEFEAALSDNLVDGTFEFEGAEYVVSISEYEAKVQEKFEKTLVANLSTYVLDAYEDASLITRDFKEAAIIAAINEETFEFDGVSYQVTTEGDELLVLDAAGERVAEFTTIAVRAYDGTDTLDIEYKDTVRDLIEEMVAAGELSDEFVWNIPQFGEDGEYVLDENGEPTLYETAMYLDRKSQSYVVSCDKVTYLIDIFAEPSSEHLYGTDADGMDVLARMMYGGRVSLMVCFVVVILSNIIGIFMGGVAGFFGGWVDNLIMRLVDIFYCIPSLPILIILGALFDQMKMEAYIRLVWMMVVLGVLGWAGIARLVRGQILSLREQEFMVAAESIGIKTRRRIFRHLVPNVMPQIIVTASSALGGIIITESTLSFLGLGVKHPLATWGTMINSVTKSAETMIAYTYIWIPVGLLICVTVIAFNFVGDGLRDAFDPKMKQ